LALISFSMQWSNLCRSHLIEARWFSSGYTPTVDEYLENSLISVGGPATIVHAYVLFGCTISKDAFDCFKHDSEPIYWASLITRLSDDLGTSEVQLFAIKQQILTMKEVCIYIYIYILIRLI
jgi:hypothetical protein